MDEFTRFRTKKNILNKISENFLSPQIFEPVIDIYLDMLSQKYLFECKLNDELPDQSRLILHEIIDELNRDIETYKEKLQLK
jgi:hypothetical protein